MRTVKQILKGEEENKKAYKLLKKLDKKLNRPKTIVITAKGVVIL